MSTLFTKTLKNNKERPNEIKKKDRNKGHYTKEYVFKKNTRWQI
jgi:hypothetical protein